MTHETPQSAPKTRRRLPFWLRAGLASAAVMASVTAAVGVGTASCSSATTNVPIRSFQSAQKIDVVCMQVGGPDASAPIQAVPPIPVTQDHCAQVPPTIVGAGLAYHLYALVTQITHGEVAVVDLTSGAIIDEDRSTPGINFLPVGTLPTDIASTPDGQISFVGSADPNNPAIYALPSTQILGDSQLSTGLPASPHTAPPKLTSWPACALPQAPGPLAIIPTSLPGVPSDAGIVGDAGDGGAPSGPGYVLAVVLPGNGGTETAKVAIIDPSPFLRGGDIDAGPGPAIVPGSASLPSCPILSAIQLADDFPAPPPTSPAWSDGVVYVDGGVTNPPLPSPALSCAANPATGVPSSPDAGATLPPTPAHASAAAHDGQTLYIADDGIPVIHVVDLSNAAAPRETAPLVARSLANPTRVVAVDQIAISPPTRNFERFLYAIDRMDSPGASLMVYDITDPATSPRVPLSRPHPEMNPFQSVDRIQFTAPVATVAFVRHDWPLWVQTNGAGVVGAAQAGLLCNPNPNVGTGSTGTFPADPGALYRANISSQVEGITPTTLNLWPARLRGVFGFATLTNGTVVAIDVDDWDGPCRRPDPMGGPDAGGDAGGPPSDIAPVEPASTAADPFNPYHVPNATQVGFADPTSQEAYFPVSAPHTLRSFYPLKNDVTAGNHAPFVANAAQLFTLASASLSGIGPGSAVNPVLLPTATTLADPYGDSIANYDGTPGVRFAWEEPQVQVDQDWSVTYEGMLPGFGVPGSANGVSFAIYTPDAFHTLTLSSSVELCNYGIEDLDVGAARAQAALTANPANLPSTLPSRLVDYVQLMDDMTNPADPYWTEPNVVDSPDASTDGGSCWQIDDPPAPPISDPLTRYNTCLSTFGLAQDQGPLRDFPILQAADDHLEIGRFFTPAGQPVGARQVASLASNQADANNLKLMKLVKCCFQNRIQNVNLRTGGEWVATGSVTGYLNHVVRDTTTNRCVQSCDTTKSLLNARSVGVLPSMVDTTGARGGLPTINRNSALAMRNPMFAYVTFTGVTQTGTAALVETVPARDDVWKFSTRGQFVPLTVNIAAGTTAVAPQSMFFIDSLGQLAVVDGSSQGLVLIDLNAVAQARTPFF